MTLDDAQITEVADAVASARRRWTGRDLTFDRELGPHDFPLPRTSMTLSDAAAEVATGRGFALLRGLPVDGISEHDAAILIRGLTAHLAPIATQSRTGHLIRHVRATGQALGDGIVRGHETSNRLWFHTDGADAAVLLCRRRAAEGGLSRLASAAAVHNAMLHMNPDAVAALYEPFHFHMAGGNVEGLPPTFISPIFSLHQSKFSTRYVRHTLLETPAVTGIALREDALAAFDLLENVAAKLCLDMELRPGDLQVVNNHTVLHSRTAYRDDDESGRHLLRCWITLPGYSGRRRGPVDEALRFGWLTDQQQREAAAARTAPRTPSAAGPRGE
ncbi:TauD/TfdA family dioxygenase [Actinoplanes rectilineatus]|uniref:TauD/TfdA family dioxygenase n=1 Tax=Actinoplanes rectilineatus TaxID=113571 RepID=UPI001B8061C4|nr:TauD/TfdA family dioxygenase [Actinoplanes rectilineatus]